MTEVKQAVSERAMKAARDYLGWHDDGFMGRPHADNKKLAAIIDSHYKPLIDELVAACEELVDVIDAIAGGNDSRHHWDEYIKKQQAAIAALSAARGEK